MKRYVFGMEPPFPPEVDSAIAGYNVLVYETMWGAQANSVPLVA